MIKSRIRNLLYSHSKGQRKLVNRPNKHFADVGKHQPSKNTTQNHLDLSLKAPYTPVA